MDIEHFIYNNNKQIIDIKTNALIKHTEIDILTIRHIVIDFMDKNFFCYKISQQQIADKIGKTRQHVCQALNRLERAGIIYKTQRYRYKKSVNKYYDNNGVNTVECEKALRTKCGYHLTPNLKNRIYEALKKGINYLAKVDLMQKVKTIVFTKTQAIKYFFSGQRVTEPLHVKDAIADKKQREEAELEQKRQKAKENLNTEAQKNPSGISALFSSVHNVIFNKPPTPKDIT